MTYREATDAILTAVANGEIAEWTDERIHWSSSHMNGEIENIIDVVADCNDHQQNVFRRLCDARSALVGEYERRKKLAA